MKRQLAVLTLGAVCALAPSAAHASQSPSDMKICNSVASNTWIWPHAVGTSETVGLAPGQCGTFANSSGQLRVHVYGESYKYGQPGQGYGACKNGPWDSDPPNSANGSTETYRSYYPSNSC